MKRTTTQKVKTHKSHDNGVYVVAIFFTFVLGLSSILFFHIHSRSMSNDFEKVNIVRDYLGIPDEIVSKIMNSKNLKGSMEFTGNLNGSYGIIIKNTGELPLSNFEIAADGKYIYPAVRPDILLPGSYGAIIFDEGVFKTIQESKTVEIRTKQGAKLLLNK